MPDADVSGGELAMHTLFSIVAMLSFMAMLVLALLSVLRDLLKIHIWPPFPEECATQRVDPERHAEAIDDAS
jgi:hypothetical protein